MRAEARAIKSRFHPLTPSQGHQPNRGGWICVWGLGQGCGYRV